MSTTTEKKDIKARKKEISKTSKYYLAVYNGVQTVGWSYVFFQSIRYMLKNFSVVGLWSNYGTELLVFQSLAALEVVHCIIGLVPSSPVITCVQVASRILQAWGIINAIPEIQDSPTVAVVIMAWGLTEVCRYSYYLMNLLGRSSSLLTWCRYTLFYGLYPAGVFGEVGNIVQALSHIKRRQLFSIMLPNPFNISFNYYYVNIFLILTYFPLFPQLYNHMRYQRAKILGRKSPAEDDRDGKKAM